VQFLTLYNDINFLNLFIWWHH